MINFITVYEFPESVLKPDRDCVKWNNRWEWFECDKDRAIYTLDCYGYISKFPSSIYRGIGKWKVRPEQIRHQQLEKDKNSPIISSMNVDIFNTPGCKYCFLQEFPLIVDRQLWCKVIEDAMETDEWKDLIGHNIELQNKYSPSDLPKEIRDLLDFWEKFCNKGCLLLDWYSSKYNINIEHDGSKYHCSLFDNIRDKYLKRMYPGIKIIRVTDYDSSKRDCLRSALTSEIDNPRESVTFDFTAYTYPERLLKLGEYDEDDIRKSSRFSTQVIFDP